MFRRSGKSGFEEQPVELYSEDSPVYSTYNKTLERRDPPLDNHTTIFDNNSHTSTSKQFSHVHSSKKNVSWEKENSINPSLREENLPSFEEELPETTIGEGVSLKGELIFERLLKIDGNFEGDLISKGKIIIGPKGQVKANINLEEAIIEGVLEGDLIVKNRAELRRGAVVLGNITAESLCIDEGVTIKGFIQVGSFPEKIL